MKLSCWIVNQYATCFHLQYPHFLYPLPPTVSPHHDTNSIIIVTLKFSSPAASTCPLNCIYAGTARTHFMRPTNITMCVQHVCVCCFSIFANIRAAYWLDARGDSWLYCVCVREFMKKKHCTCSQAPKRARIFTLKQKKAFKFSPAEAWLLFNQWQFIIGKS